MENVQKYFAIFEDLERNASHKNNLKINIDVIAKYIKLNTEFFLTSSALKSIVYNSEEILSEDPAWCYSTLLFHILLTINQNIDLNSNNKDELVSLQQQEFFAKFVFDAAKYGICPNLMEQMKEHQIFKINVPQSKLNLNRLRICLRFFEQIYKIDFLVGGSKIDQVKLETMAAAVSILSFDCNQNKAYGQEFLTHLFNRSCKISYFKNLLILKSIRKLPDTTKNVLHEDLLVKLQSPIGFKLLLEAIVPIANDKAPNWKCFDVIADIVSHKGHSEIFYNNLLIQIFDFLQTAAAHPEYHIYVPAGVLSLRKLYSLNNMKIKILEKIDKIFKVLYDPEDLITGVILFENNEFESLLKVLNFFFCGSSLHSLPSEILIPYLPLLIQCYDQIPNNYKQAKLVKDLVVHCLMNRKESELKILLRSLVLGVFEEKYKLLHSRITFNLRENSELVNLQICPYINNRNDIFIILCRILKLSNNNILIYNCFISVLDLFEKEFFFGKSINDSSVLLESQEELDTLLEKKFKSKFAIISFLTELIEFKPLHSQFNENPKEILDFLKSSLCKALDNTSSEEEKLSIMLAILQELIENSKDTTIFQNFIVIIKKLLGRCQASIKYQLEHILNLLEGNILNGTEKLKSFEKSNYEIARNLIEENQPYLKVYGIALMIKLVNKNDLETINNKHRIVAMALHILKDEESYVFLNCVKLFEALIQNEEADILSILSDEYLSDNNDSDYRLKIGEVILKVTEYLGPISYKYKNVLINCFLNGCRDILDEFRLSSISNLATTCKLLTYQVHNFFQELLQLIESILQTDKYLPAKRAAVLVLDQLLSGIDNLLDFQEYLLPIYRILKHIAANGSDYIMQIHANNGLKTLSEKCKKMFFAEENLQKEIKIFGIKDKQPIKNSKNILEIN